MIDVNVNVSRWPFRRVAGDDPSALVSLLRQHGASQAWAGSFDGLLHKDISAVNARLAGDCAANRGFLLPFGSINPTLPDWQEDLRRVHEVHRMPGIRLHPNYHGYRLEDPVTAELLGAAAQRKLIVQIALAMEDDRTQHPLNSGNSTPKFAGVHWDFAMLESPYAVRRVVAAVGLDWVVFGSHAPLFYFSSATLKVKEAGLPPDREKAILEGNARRLCCQ